MTDIVSHSKVANRFFVILPTLLSKVANFTVRDNVQRSMFNVQCKKCSTHDGIVILIALQCRLLYFQESSLAVYAAGVACHGAVGGYYAVAGGL